MIILVTGAPGDGKTLLTLAAVMKRAASENRAVYYSGIEILKPELFPGWVKLDDPEKWYELPDGAIVLHDECQELYRPRQNGSRVPKYVSELETHRHKGFDIYFITQHPGLVDVNLRRLVGEHMHVVRAFGSKVATVHRFKGVRDEVVKSRAGSLKEQVVYPRALFDAYVSATVHTHKMRLPARLVALPVFFVVAGVLVWFVVSWVRGSAGKGQESVAVAGKSGVVSASPSPGQPVTAGLDWAEDRKPRVVGLPHTAPVYDKVTVPVRAPHPAGCIASASACVCYTSQATRLGMADALCREIAAHGYFVAWDDGARPQVGRAVRSEGQGASGAPAAAVGVGGGAWGGVAAADTWGGVR
ncbi:hypothetical protein CJ010_14660 [Azoarcus sp. DD4]|uniref:zonular occludens toxin domain-containing protein n=1 Tax=Azoarcus sp. DD4 TaxID=2027405 RepID=UPI001126A6FC|nr:zonular occludens toxin domain-containing protein [Azoarcus sp. DD4]QDF97682.1 hypothetical protein CJ010_14660 [Azoarcus sp. DD4]